MVSLDQHTFSVIASDFVPIVPYSADWIFVGIGQRYDVVITANQTSGNCKCIATTSQGVSTEYSCQTGSEQKCLILPAAAMPIT